MSVRRMLREPGSIEQSPVHRTGLGQAIAKRLVDLFISIPALILMAPVLMLLGLWIKIDSHGPMFYRGVRAGRFGKPFRILKLRTMAADAEKTGGSETAADDPRITRAGSHLRRWKLDEFPQLVNVIRGDMSLVGPRPEVMNEVKCYSEAERQLLLVRPGMTDWASIKFRWEQELLRDAPDPHLAYHQRIRPEKLRLGLQYVQHRSLLVDCQILAATIRSLFTRFEPALHDTARCGSARTDN